jgi:hypothetical protein
MLQKSMLMKCLRNVKHVFNNVLIMDLKHDRCLKSDESSAECAVTCPLFPKIILIAKAKEVKIIYQ